MKTISVFLACLALVASSSFAPDMGFSRSRRSLAEFHSMIKAATNRNPLDYNGYGCYCGLGGRGRPVDRLDRCCQVHDYCYTILRNRNICNLLIYILPYKRSSSLKCASSNNNCASRLCKCDLVAALCFKRARYNRNFKNYDKKNKC